MIMGAVVRQILALTQAKYGWILISPDRKTVGGMGRVQIR